MKLHLIDISEDLVTAWRRTFAHHPEVEVANADLLTVAHNTVVSPANSSGFMDGGIDRAYLTHFGPKLQQIVHARIAERPEGLLPLGASLLVVTGHPRIPYLIVAPTMETPEFVSRNNTYRAMRAVLRLARQNSNVVSNLFCPGLGTGVGGVDPNDAADAMANAYDDWLKSP